LFDCPSHGFPCVLPLRLAPFCIAAKVAVASQILCISTTLNKRNEQICFCSHIQLTMCIVTRSPFCVNEPKRHKKGGLSKQKTLRQDLPQPAG